MMWNPIFLALLDIFPYYIHQVCFDAQFISESTNVLNIFLLLIFTASETSSVSATSSATSAVRKHPDLPKDKPDNNQETEGEDASLAAEVGIEDEDTMKNLTKTFAGIFGKMN